MSTGHETNHSGVILSGNTCRKISSNAWPSKKEKRGHVCFVYNGKRKKLKKSLSWDWAENLAESVKGVLIRPGAMAEELNWQLSAKFSARRSKITIEEPLEDLESGNTETTKAPWPRYRSR